MGISDLQFAGDYVEMAAFIKNMEYHIMSSAPNDYITVRSNNDGEVMEHGPAPLTFITSSDTLVTIHFNLIEPPCGSDTDIRLTSITNVGLPINVTKVGINTLTPQATLDINGKIRIADDDSTALAGMLRYNEDKQDFEGFDGSKWRSLTTAGWNWGQVVDPKVGESNKITLSDGSPFDLFGNHIAHDGQTLVVASYGEDIEGNQDQGRIYVYEDDGVGYALKDTLDDPNGSLFGIFGNGDLAINGDYVIVGSGQNMLTQDGGNNGSATIYKKMEDSWEVDDVFTDSADGSKEIGGGTVNIHPPYAVCAGLLNNEVQVFIYKKTGEVWNEIQVVESPSIQNGSGFGAHVVIDEARLFVSAPDVLFDNNRKGQIYVYENDGNDQYQIVDSIQSNLVHEGANSYGVDFSVDGDYLAVGDPREEYDDIDRRGAVDVHHYNNGEWTLEATIRAPAGSDNDLFGSNVDILGDEIIVGCIGVIGAEIEDHKAFVYKKVNDSWNNTAILRPTDSQADSHFGTDVAIGSNVIFVSDFHDDVNGNFHQGSVYIYCR